MTWDHHTGFAFASAVLWILGIIPAWNRVRKYYLWTIITYAAGIVVYAVFIGGLWVSQQRPPLATMGEVRLWYTLFLSFAGLITYMKWKFPWILPLSTVMALVFSALNILRPQIHSHVLMPALQSIWFIPHVTVYMFSYGLLACSFLLAVVGFFRPNDPIMPAIDKLTRAGFAFFTIGMLLGSIWARLAWGDYWTWDPKETWAAVTWLL